MLLRSVPHVDSLKGNRTWFHSLTDTWQEKSPRRWVLPKKHQPLSIALIQFLIFFFHSIFSVLPTCLFFFHSSLPKHLFDCQLVITGLIYLFPEWLPLWRQTGFCLFAHCIICWFASLRTAPQRTPPLEHFTGLQEYLLLAWWCSLELYEYLIHTNYMEFIFMHDVLKMKIYVILAIILHLFFFSWL